MRLLLRIAGALSLLLSVVGTVATARADDDVSPDRDLYGLAVPAGKADAYARLSLRASQLTGTRASGLAYERPAGLAEFAVARTSPSWKTVLGAMGGYDLRVAAGVAGLTTAPGTSGATTTTGVAYARLGFPIALTTDDGRFGGSIEVGGEAGYDGGRTFGPGFATLLGAVHLGMAPTSGIALRLDYEILPFMMDTAGLDDVVEHRLGASLGFGVLYAGATYCFGVAKNATAQDHYVQLGGALGVLMRL